MLLRPTMTWPRWAPPPSHARPALTFAGVVLVVVDVALRSIDRDFGVVLPAIAWAGAAASFVGAFVASMSEVQGDAVGPDGKSTEPSGPSSTNGTATAGPDGHPPAPPAEKPPERPAPPPAASTPEPLIRPGNPLRIVRGGVTAAVSAFLLLLLMGHEGQSRWGVPFGALLATVSTWGVMDLLGTFDDPVDRVACSTSLSALAKPLVSCGAAWLLFAAALGLAQAGAWLPGVAWGLVVTLAFVGAVATTFEVGVKLGVWKVAGAEGIPLSKRHGFWVVTLAAALYFPFMGTSSLWDPWETHYGEVAREMLGRDDWISLWWAQDGWFWSKPVLDMWMQAIAMATLGVHYQPDKMLTGGGSAPIMHPEWVVRAPVVLITILAMYLLYKGVARTFGRRAALLGSLVLATMPDWYLLAHQTMTDMPFVAAMVACMGLLMLGMRASPDTLVSAYEMSVGKARVRLSAWHLVFGAVLVCAIPQILYLASRNVEFLWHPGAYGFHPHWDEFRSGSGGGNCGLPGNEDCRLTQPAFIPHGPGATPTTFVGTIARAAVAFEPALQALLWAGVLGTALYLSWGERRAQRLSYLGAWFFAALSTLGKGPAGFGLPVLIALAGLAAARPTEDAAARILRVIRELTRFEILAGLLVLLAVAMPWYVAMYVRHGPPFTDRLIFHDMFDRAFRHVHDTNEGDDTSLRFYVWQLGYALFPWTGFAPLGLLWWLRRGSTAEENARADMAALLCLWFVLGFCLFSFMGTKFHHYIFPAVPPVAMLIGIALDEILGRRELPFARSWPPYALGLTGGLALVVYGVSRTQPGSFFGFKGLASPLAPPSPALAIAVIVAGAALVVATVVTRGGGRDEADAGDADASSVHAARMIAASAIAGALVLVVVGRDFVAKGESADQPGAIRLLHLYTYNYRRPWPEVLDFSAALTAFTAVAAVVSLAFAFRAVRRHAVAGMCALSVVWALWGLDVYMQKTAQHWGQHEIIAAYYADRSSPSEQLIAYQMNWKGENFYTGNHVPAFVSTGSTFTQWLKKQRESGAKVMYFITEHGRIGGLKNEVAAKSYREVTDKALNNKFILVRAEL